ncbi:uncharacterized protein LOC110246438 [Exaiptasia diaphana]|uniref:Uncharacterized protein n=1 Tax=Exaiptasia diaphana TaxID=2652724 RepID=A0A913XR74_EXADI|nr:uncharacterized protein LOC110246438 [Exaiptasia diaphana]
MRKFTSDQFLKDMPLPIIFQDKFKPIFERLFKKQSGTLSESTCSIPSVEGTNSMLSTMLLSVGPLKKGVWACKSSLYNCSKSYARDCLDLEFLPYLKETYHTLFDEVDDASVTAQFERFSSCSFNAETLGSSGTIGKRSSFILARWCKLGGRIDASGVHLRPGVIRYFLKQNVKVAGEYISCIFAVVHWFKEHPAKNEIGPPIEIWCRDIFEIDGPANYIPVQRIHQKFVPAIETFKREKVLVVCPLPKKIQV